MKKIMMLILALAMMLGASGALAATYAPKNHWGASDVRLYLNNGAQKGGEWQVDSVSDSNNATGYAALFSKEEFDRIIPMTFETVVDGESYWTRDRFYLPSGNMTDNQILSRGEADISVPEVCAAVFPEDVIPISYWAEHDSYSMVWLRSKYDAHWAFTSLRGQSTHTGSVNDSQMIAPLFRVNLKNVAFASCASAAELLNSSAKKFLIVGSTAYGKKTDASLPGYGMYLKLTAPMEFSVNSLEFDGLLRIDYTNASKNYALVVCAYESDDLQAGTEAYCGAAPVSSESGSIVIDVSNWGRSSLDGLTIQVWLEEIGTSSLAMATKPVTFVGRDGGIQKTEADASNKRVFASRDDLSCSWGALANADALVGSRPSNQKIYYGKDSGGRPMEFWIAGVENNIMTLYQAKPTQSTVFKAGSTQVKNPADLTKPNVPDPDTSDDPIFGMGESTAGAADAAQLPKTGDNSTLSLWVMLLGVAGAAMLTLKKRAQN